MSREGAIDATSLTPAELVKLLKKAGSKNASEALIAQCQVRGAPVNPDGRIHFVHFTAWLAQQIK